MIGIVNDGWKRKANHDLWAQFDLVRGPNVVFVYVNGHDGNPGNERADVLAGRQDSQRVSIRPLDPGLVVLRSIVGFPARWQR